MVPQEKQKGRKFLDCFIYQIGAFINKTAFYPVKQYRPSICFNRRKRKWKSSIKADSEETSDQERCTKLPALNARQTAKCLLSPPRESLCSARHATRNEENTKKHFPTFIAVKTIQPFYYSFFYFFTSDEVVDNYLNTLRLHAGRW